MAKASTSSSSSRAAGMAAERKTESSSSKPAAKESTRGANTSVKGKTPSTQTPTQLAKSFGGTGSATSGTGKTPTNGGLKSAPLTGGKTSTKDVSIGNLANGISSVIGSLIGGLTGQAPAQPAPSGLSVKKGAGTPTGFKPTGNKTKDSFLTAIMPLAIKESKRTGIDPRIIVAQAAVESEWGKKAPGNNFFGIKSHGKPGGQTVTTHEVINGKRVKVKDSFAQYASLEDSVKGYGDFILANPRYKPVMNAQGIDAQLAALGASGYASEPTYGKLIQSVAKGIQLDSTPSGSAKTAPQAGPFGYMFGAEDPAPGTGKVTAEVNKDSSKMKSNPIETALKFALDPVGTAFKLIDSVGKNGLDKAQPYDPFKPHPAMDRIGRSSEPSRQPTAIPDPVVAAPSVAAAIAPSVAATTENPLLLSTQRKPFWWSNIKVL